MAPIAHRWRDHLANGGAGRTPAESFCAKPHPSALRSSTRRAPFPGDLVRITPCHFDPNLEYGAIFTDANRASSSSAAREATVTFEYVSVEEAIKRRGVRMVVVGDVPSPWGEAAKGILHIKGLAWVAVRLAYDSELLKEWAGQRSAPVVVYENERPRSGWAEILLLAERLAPAPPLLPKNPTDRALVFGLAHEICGEGGLGWSRRLQLVHAGLHNAGGFPERVSKYLSKKYGYRPEAGAAAGGRVAELLGMLVARLKAQHQAGSRYYVGNSLTATDVYSATFAAMFDPLPPEQCKMDASTRVAFRLRDAHTDAVLDPILFEHRDMMYREYLELPLSL
jgi:glutathione S-transferase